MNNTPPLVWIKRMAAVRAQLRTPGFWMLMLILGAVGARLGYVLIAHTEGLHWGDELSYDRLAYNLSQGDGFCFVPGKPSLQRAPLYPLILSGFYTLFGQNYFLIRVMQALAGGLSVWLTILVARRLFIGWVGPLLAGAGFAFHPLLIFTTNLLYTETFYLLLLLIFTWSCFKLLEAAETSGRLGSASILWSIASGVILGLSILMKPNLLLLPPALLLWLWISLKNLPRALGLTVGLTLAAVVVVAPWTWRNYLVSNSYQGSGALVLVSANSGLNLWQGNHPEATGTAFPLDQVDPLPGLSDVERDQVYQQWAVEQIRSDVGRFFALIPQKLAKFFAALETSNRGRMLVRFGFLIDLGWGAFLLVALAGAILTVKRWREWALIDLLILYPAGLAAVFYGGTRYGRVTYPFLFFLAVETLLWVYRLLTTRRQKQSALG